MISMTSKDLKHRIVELENRIRELETLVQLDRALIEVIPLSLLVFDNRLRVISANHNFLIKGGRTLKATLGKEVTEVFSPAVLSYTKLEQRMRGVFETGASNEGGQMTRLPGLPGRVYFYRLTPLKGERGDVDSVVLLMEDVTEQTRLGMEIRQWERRLASVVDSASDIVVSTDVAGQVMTWNRAAERISGWSAAEAIGQNLASLCAPDDQDGMCQMLRDRARGVTGATKEIGLVTTEGRDIPVAWSCSPMRDDMGQIGGIVAVGRDLTETRELEARLMQSAKMASLGVMAGGIAHEIRNPLSISSAVAQLLLERPGDIEFQRQCVEKLRSGIERASNIIEDLLRFARPSDESLSAVDINRVVEDTLSLLANQAKVQHITCEMHKSPDVPKVQGNAGLLQQLVSNLILNAINAMPDGGKLTIKTQLAPVGQVEILVSDTGSGIPREDQSKIFDPFYTTMPVGQGTGLGLSIAYTITTDHGGTIRLVRSEPGEGSTFSVMLPVSPTETGESDA